MISNMISKKLASIGLAAALVAVLPAVSAQAQSPRTFVSAAGSDSNPCSFAAPCRHFQAAVNATTAGGEVDALDPAGYGPININQAITIEGQGWSYIAPPTSGNGITINAVSGNVTVHGVSINGAGIAGGTNGIVFNSGGNLTVTDCVAENFVFDGSNITTGNGILIQPTSGTVGFVITNTIVAGNGSNGIQYVPASGTPNANGLIDNVTATGNGFFGIAINPLGSTGGATVVSISNSRASNNAAGISAENTGVKVSVDNVTVAGNSADGIFATGSAVVLLGRSVITGNGTGIQNATTPNGFFTYKDNRIDKNTTADVSGPLNTSLTTQ
jgi:hypothetical protein